MPITVLPTAIATTFFPKIVSNFKNKNDNNFLYNLINKVLFISSVSFALIVTFNAESIMTTIFSSQYALSSIPMILLIWSCIFQFFCYVSLDFFTADSKQKINLIFSIFVVVLSLMLLFPLIQKYSYTGAAFSKLLVSIIGTVFIILNLGKLNIKPQFINYNILVWLVVNLTSCYLLSFMPLILYLFLTPLVLVISTIILKCFSESEILTILQKINKEKWAKLLT
jgi:O-antigen/teichoic acid export membrane protein